jgi:hypothetical protein
MGRDAEAVEILSRDRLAGYTLDGGPNSDQHLLGRYLYNLAVSEALYPMLHTLEVVLRNRIHEAASLAFPIVPKRRLDYHLFPCWIDARHSPVLKRHRENGVEKAKKAVTRNLRKRNRNPQDPQLRTPGRLVAELTFAFWVYLFDPEYGTEQRPGPLWPDLLAPVFPHRHGRVDTGLIRKRLRRILVVRNRVMHYERIVPYSDNQGHLDPLVIRREILEMTEWMSPRAANALRYHGPFEAVFRPSFARCMQLVARRV